MNQKAMHLHELLEPCGDQALPLPKDDVNQPIFPEPWQAEVLATTVELSRKGVFTWKAWVECFSAEIARSPQFQDEDPNDAYYRQWLAALETILLQCGVVQKYDLIATTEHWRRSYVHTEHGKPVQFRRDLPATEFHEHEHEHEHEHRPDDEVLVAKPVAISRAISQQVAGGA